MFGYIHILSRFIVAGVEIAVISNVIILRDKAVAQNGRSLRGDRDGQAQQYPEGFGVN
ncbi:hypothetical protein D3C80_1954530 [compost metagenome]